MRISEAISQKPFFVCGEDNNIPDIFFSTAKEVVDYCYKIGLENVFDIGYTLWGTKVFANCSHLTRYADQIKDIEERVKSLSKILQIWKNDDYFENFH